MCRVHALTPYLSAQTWSVYVRAGIHRMMTIRRVLLLVFGATLLPLAAANQVRGI